VYSTYFLFGKQKTIDLEGKDGDDRALLPAQAFDTSKPHLLIKGEISFVNSFGFLNADQYPLM